MEYDIKASQSASSPSWIYREVKWLSIGLERVVKRARPGMWWWCMRTCEWGTHEAFLWRCSGHKRSEKKRRGRKRCMKWLFIFPDHFVVPLGKFPLSVFFFESPAAIRSEVGSVQQTFEILVKLNTFASHLHGRGWQSSNTKNSHSLTYFTFSLSYLDDSTVVVGVREN